MEFKLKDFWTVCPLIIKLLSVLYLLVVITLQFTMNLLSTVFLASEGRNADNTKFLFWFISIAFWIVYVLFMGITVSARDQLIKEASLEEFLIQYFKIRPLASTDVYERRQRWELLAQNMNEYIHTMHVYDRSVMQRFNYTDESVEAYVTTLIQRFDWSVKWLSPEASTLEMLPPRSKLLSKLKQVHYDDGAFAYKDILEDPDRLYNGGTSSKDFSSV